MAAANLGPSRGPVVSALDYVDGSPDMSDDAQYLRAARAEQHAWRREQFLKELGADGPGDLPDGPGEYGSRRRRWNEGF